MTLTTRLSVFFLSALAAVLAGFSFTLYYLAKTHLHRQVDDRLASALQTLAVAVEQDSEGLEWEPSDRHLTLGQGDTTFVRWSIRGDGQRLKDQSPKGMMDDFFTQEGATGPKNSVFYFQGEPWQLARTTITSAPTSPVPQEKDKSLTLTASVSLVPVNATLQNLRWTLSGMSLGLWILAAVGGRFLGRRALVPLSRMAASARSIRATTLDQRLPAPETHDELDELAQSFNELLERLQESFERQRRFTGDASHQLRTPLAAMLGQVEVALRRERTSVEYQHTLTIVQDQASRLRQIVEMLLFLARADADAKLPDPETVRFDTWLGDHIQTWREHPRAEDIQVDLPPAGAFLVSVQEPLLGQLVDNLVDNACKYSERGTPITLRLWAKDEIVAVEVEDQGPGISPDELPCIFEPFYRSSEARKQGRAGVGLGLAVARRIATVLGGSLEARSAIGHGARFTLTLPRKISPARTKNLDPAISALETVSTVPSDRA